MKPKQISQVTPYLMDGHLIISLDRKWLDVCKGIPTFAAVIDKEGRLNLLGPTVLKKEEMKLDD